MSLLMQLPECDNGFAQDFYHPRFAAALLLIGDALDIDNQRFHPFAQQQAGRLFNKQSEMHYRKHHAIRALQITPERIYIRADCQDPSEMRQFRNEVNWLQELSRNAVTNGPKSRRKISAAVFRWSILSESAWVVCP